jgi:predicted nucleic acid-binding protein
LIRKAGVEVWPLEEDDVLDARQMFDRFPQVEARDLCHLASCRRRGVERIFTFDRVLNAIDAQSGLFGVTD